MMPQLYVILAISCLIYTTCAKDIVLPPDMQSFELIPKFSSGWSKTEWNVKACEQCKIIAICKFLGSPSALSKENSCSMANITLNTGKETLIKCAKNGFQFLTPSDRNSMIISIEINSKLAGAVCDVKSTIPFIGRSEPAEPDSHEHGLERKSVQKPTCRCGWRNKSPQRIVNGTHASLHEFPFIARIVLRKSRQGFCGGSIITNRHVLTASHCTVPYMKYALSVALGEHDVTTALETAETRFYDVERVINHYKYDPVTDLNDISILLISTPIIFNDVIGPICLPEIQRDLFGKYIKVMGWGRTRDEEEGGQVSPILNKVNLLVVEPSICRAVFLTTPSIKRQICTFRNNKDSCTGDSGGPLVWRDPNTNMYKQVALVSFGLKCAKTNPGVNTDVAYYMDWIKEVIRVTAPAEICH